MQSHYTEIAPDPTLMAPACAGGVIAGATIADPVNMLVLRMVEAPVGQLQKCPKLLQLGVKWIECPTGNQTDNQLKRPAVFSPRPSFRCFFPLRQPVAVAWADPVLRRHSFRYRPHRLYISVNLFAKSIRRSFGTVACHLHWACFWWAWTLGCSCPRNAEVPAAVILSRCTTGAW